MVVIGISHNILNCHRDAESTEKIIKIERLKRFIKIEKIVWTQREKIILVSPYALRK